MRENEAHQQHLLHLVENALREGRSEPEIVRIVDDAAEADVELDTAA